MFPQPKYGKGLGNHAENVTRINAGLDRGAHVCPVVTKVEHIDELLRGAYPCRAGGATSARATNCRTASGI